MKAVAALLLVLGCLAVSQAWRCGPVRRHLVKQVDAGMGMVVATDIDNQAHSLSGRNWYRLGTFKHVSVGPSGVWGTDPANRVYSLGAGYLRRVNGLTMPQVDAGGGGQVVGVNPSNNYIFCLRSVDALIQAVNNRWTRIPATMKYISCGPLYGCWGVNHNSQVYVSWGGISPTTCSNIGWVSVPGPAMKMIEVGTDGSVFGVSTTGTIYQRHGMTARFPQGTVWGLVPMSMTVQHVSYDRQQLWVVTISHLLMR
ncbi:fish-egg lectin-like [Limanda limanda]|uniref:fish-egg lectin-like n=1 Tax=Limanda limanda TaxID=27771 RepID=UPI0029C8F7D8|nr:fish-egg lectin-like [Limanda limanda]